MSTGTRTGGGTTTVTDWTDPEVLGAVLDRASDHEAGVRPRFEDLTPDTRLEHDRSLRLTTAGTHRWTAATLNHDPAFHAPAAAQRRDYPEPPVHPDYLVACVAGASAADVAGPRGAELARGDVDLQDTAVSPGTELRAESVVTGRRALEDYPEYGYVTWRTRGIDADTDETLVSFERTTLVPRRERLTDGGEDAVPDDWGDPERADAEDVWEDPGEAGESWEWNEPGDDGDAGGNSGDGGSTGGGAGDGPGVGGPALVAPEGPYFEDYRDALDRTEGRDAAVGYTHDRGRRVTDGIRSGLVLSTLNGAVSGTDDTAPAGVTPGVGDVARSVAMGLAREHERTYRERSYDDELFHHEPPAGSTLRAFTRVVDCGEAVLSPDVGRVEFHHVAYVGDGHPIYSGRRTAMLEKRE